MPGLAGSLWKMCIRDRDQVRQIQGDPVEHDAGDDNVDIAVGTQRTGNGTEERAGSNSQQQAQVPRQLPGDRGIKADACARDILTGRADVEHADLIGEQDGQRTQQQRRRADERLAEIPASYTHLRDLPIVTQAADGLNSLLRGLIDREVIALLAHSLRHSCLLYTYSTPVTMPA